MTEKNKITGIVVGQYGEAIQIQIVDADGATVNISSYTTKQIAIRSEDAQQSKTYTAPFVTDGTDGKLSFTPATGDIDRNGLWEGQAILSTASSKMLTVLFTMEVGEALG